MEHPKAALAMSRQLFSRLFDAPRAARLRQVADVDTTVVLEDFAGTSALSEAEVLITGWGCPRLDETALGAAGNLRAIFHTAGSVKGRFTEEVWRRGIRVSSAVTGNALPVAEYTVAAILFANKRVLPIAAEYRRLRDDQDWHARYPDMGNFGKRVGVIGASRIGRRVLELLRPFDLDLVVSDPYLSAAEAASLGAELAGVAELCATCDVVSVHAPALPETRHLIDTSMLALLRDGATLVNTARGALVDHDALVKEVLTGRIYAVLDVTEPWTPPRDWPLYDHPHVLLTPHIAGSQGTELGRLADSTLEELSRYAAGQPLLHEVLADHLPRSA